MQSAAHLLTAITQNNQVSNDVFIDAQKRPNDADGKVFIT